jgi:predicted TIM-barrel enzyme
MARIERKKILERFRGMIAKGSPSSERARARALRQVRGGGRHRPHRHLQLGRYRMAGRGSLAGVLAYGNANEIVVDMAREVLPVVKHTPGARGVNGTDPFMIRAKFLRDLADLGFCGVQNFPTVGLIDGVFRANLEETGMGYGLEVDMIRAAHEMDLLTTPYVFRRAAGRGHGARRRRHRRLPPRPHHGRRIGAETAVTLADCVPRIDAWAAAARARARRRDRPLPRRPDRRARGRGVRAARMPRDPRLLRRFQHGAPAH